MNLNEDLGPADLKFLEKWGHMGEDADEADAPDATERDTETEIPVEPVEPPVEAEGEDAPEGEHVHAQDAEGEGFDMEQRERDEKTREDLKAFQDAQDAREERSELPESDRGGDRDTDTAPQGGEDADKGEDEGEDAGGPEEAQDDAQSDAEAEEEADGEDQPAGEEQAPAEEGEADEDGEPDDDNQPEDSEGEENGEEEAEEDAPEQEQQDAEPNEPEPIALDTEGNPIFVGSKIVSKADGNFVDEDSEPYVADVLGAWAGADGFANDNPAKRILIVERYDEEDDSDSEMRTADGRAGWAVQSDLCAVVAEEDEPEEYETEDEQDADEPEPEPQDEQPEPEPEEEKTVYFLDADGEPLHDGDQVIVREIPNWCDWPEEAIAECVMAVRNGVSNPALLPMNFEAEGLGSWRSYDDRPAFAVSWGNQLSGMYALRHDDERPEQPRPKPEPPQEERPEPQQPEAEADEPEAPSDPERKPMTKTQRERFENLATRIFKKAEDTFGKTKQSAEVGALLPGGIFDGEEIGQTLEVMSGGVLYRISFSAERVDERSE